MRLEFLKLEEELKKECGNKPVYYLANYGNWGDGLIRCGTLKFFRDIGLEYKEKTMSKKDWLIPAIGGGTVIFGGGGGWCSHWEDNLYVIKKLKKRFKLIVLPSTYESNYPWENTSFWRRDELQSKEVMPDAKFCHDMAFYLGGIEAKKGNGTGCFFRTDKESTQKIEIPPSNVDISKKGNHFSDMNGFFDAISKYEVIYTDRLHVAIASCLLGREVHIFSNAYFKVRSVYEASIKEYFKNAHFHEDWSIPQNLYGE